MTEKSNILVMRLSSLGDVAMTIPVIYSVAANYPQHTFYVLTRKRLSKLFINHPVNVKMIPADLTGEHKGFWGLLKILLSARKYRITHIVDLHNVLRTQFIRFFFRLSGKNIAYIDKGRDEKKKLTQKENKIFRPLKSTIQRYIEVFERNGLYFQPAFSSVYEGVAHDFSKLSAFSVPEKKGIWIGIAPFAKYREKTYPMEKTEVVLKKLLQNPDVSIFLFGEKGHEEKILRKWEKENSNVICIVGTMGLDDELLLISRLNVMLTMDSANMHLASLVDVPVVSVWGATHIYAGFYGWNQDPGHIIQIELNCRPCSVFGNKPCFRKDHACMVRIEPEQVYDKIQNVLNRRSF